ncbi:MAG TPA: anhydro-N-acetylmuramic acid kinase, partial [Bacteroidetes bacterium]|nr:anhydro-N-acetylmuramic acid kinase [Bacteroidota bacterium]
DPFPKSLDNNFIKNNFIPILEQDNSSIEDKMATSVELIAKTLHEELKNNFTGSNDIKVLITGGGARNTFLVNRIKTMSSDVNIIIPDNLIIDFKEALMIAYMGYLRVNKLNNVLSSVTGAARDSVGGAMCIA